MQAVVILMYPDHITISDDVIQDMQNILDKYNLNYTEKKTFYDGKCQQFFIETENDLKDLQTEISVVIHPYKIDVAVLPAEGRQKKILVSDMDSTMINQECIDELADFIHKKAEISSITEQAMRGELNFDQSLTQRVALLKGLEKELLKKCYQERITFMSGAKELLAYMQSIKAKSILVSGGFTFFAEKVADSLGFNGFFANELCFDVNNMLDGTVKYPILGRDAKAEILQSHAEQYGVSLEDTMAVGDGANDLAMIQKSGLGIAYHAKPKVAEAARVAIHFCDLKALIYITL